MENSQTLHELEQILKTHSDDTKPLRFRDACVYLGCSSSYLYKLTHRKSIPYYKPNGKMIYFKKLDLEQYLLRNRIKSIEEIENEASQYVVNGRKGVKKS